MQPIHTCNILNIIIIALPARFLIPDRLTQLKTTQARLTMQPVHLRSHVWTIREYAQLQGDSITLATRELGRVAYQLSTL